jgi:hypothetical protein
MPQEVAHQRYAAGTFGSRSENKTETGSSCIVENPLSNGVCNNFAVHARTTISFGGEKSSIVGDIGVSPGTSITGDYAIAPGGQVREADTEAASGFFDAFTAAMVQRSDETYWGVAAVEMGGKTFTPGTYRAGSTIAITTPVTLDGEGSYLFQAGTTLDTAANTYFILKNGAKAENIIWAIGSAVTLGADSTLEGSILAGTAITFGTKTEVRGCAIAQSTVVFGSRGYVNVRKQTNGDPSCPGSSSCENFAIHARTMIALGAATAIPNGDVGVAPGISITGTYALSNGSTISTEDSQAFAVSAIFNHAELRSQRLHETYWGVAAFEMGGKTFTPGTYRAGSSLAITTSVTLDGEGPYLFQAGSTLTTAAASKVILTNGAKAENIIWALGTAATLGADSILEGSVLAGTAITLGAGTVVHGCTIAQSAVTTGALASVGI